MPKKVVLLLQGGGALGAFQCGVWQALFPFLRENQHTLVAVAGMSIGAVNAGLIARHYYDDADGGCRRLEDFWRRTVATPPALFFPWPGEYWQAWNGLLIALLLGNRAYFYPAYAHWNPFGDLFRFQMPLYQTQYAEKTLKSAFTEYQGKAPLLAVGVTDVKTGEAVLFDSANQCITPKMLAASIGIPLLFSPIEIEGRYYWDGEMRSNTLLPDIYMLLCRELVSPDSLDEFLIILVDMFKQDTDHVPTSSIESQYRFINILLGGKHLYDRRELSIRNTYLDAIERIRKLASSERHSPLVAAIEEEYQKLLTERHARIEILHIGRQQFEYEHISRDFDYSPHYIARLIAQGKESASIAVSGYVEKARRDQEEGQGFKTPNSMDEEEKSFGGQFSRNGKRQDLVESTKLGRNKGRRRQK